MKVLKPEQFKEGDFLEFERTDGMKFRGFVQIKGREYCKLIFVHFSHGRERERIGKQIRLYYDETISYDGMIIKNIKTLKTELMDEDLHALMNLALTTNDREWFDEIGERRIKSGEK